MLFLNARSLKHKVWELHEYIETLETWLKAICVNETFANESVSDAQLGLQGYEMIVRRDGKDTQGGNVEV